MGQSDSALLKSSASIAQFGNLAAYSSPFLVTKLFPSVYVKRGPFCVYAFGCFWRAILAVPPLLGGVAGVVLGRLGVGLPLARRPCSCGARVRLTENLDAAASKFLRGLCGAVPLPARPLNLPFRP